MWVLIDKASRNLCLPIHWKYRFDRHMTDIIVVVEVKHDYVVIHFSLQTSIDRCHNFQTLRVFAYRGGSFHFVNCGIFPHSFIRARTSWCVCSLSMSTSFLPS